ncbi:MAG: 4-hydroxy-tetrahydrodipicolinate reductase [Oscillospiraceae bacterium]|nr:4-hydroxy-tetrahydrodipicolinate reductase [Oscillospiraceae bacterium]
MLNIILSGCNGYMGRVVASIVNKDPDVTIVAGVDIDSRQTSDFPVFKTASEYTGNADVLVDFSSSSALDGLLSFCLSRKIPPILCSTGYSPEQLDAIASAAEIIPVFRSANMSLGINLLADLIRRACSVLGEDYDVEIVERHHRRKIDAPSGTALMLADAAADALQNNPQYVFERQSRRQQRDTREIGISAIRGGTIVGEHEVIFAGLDEVIELRHTAASRDVFAVGAIRAAKFMVGISAPGLYNMSHVLAKI